MRFFILVMPLLALAAPAAAQSFRGHNTKAPLSYSADRTEGSLRDDRAIFSGNVIVRQDDLTLNAARITVAFVDGKSKTSINRIDAAGGVFVRRGAETAQGIFAVYDPTSKLITVVGDVTLTQNGSIARGERLVIDLDTGRAILSGGGAPSDGASSTPGAGRVTGTFTVPTRTN
jgi:lipopolysaccharide export system protein LptA